MNKKFAILSLTLLMAYQSEARPLTDSEKTIVTEEMDALAQAMNTSDAAALVSGYPPEILQTLAEQIGLTVDDLTKKMTENTAALLKNVQFSDAKYDIDIVDITEGKDLDYGFDIMEFQVHANQQVQNTDAPVLLLHKRDSDKWYALRVEDSDLPIVKQVYPELADIKLPKQKQ